MNEDLVEKIAQFVERQCPRKMLPGAKCSEYSCTVHWMAGQIRRRRFETPDSVLHPALESPGQRALDDVEELKKAEEEYLRRHAR